MDGLRGIASLAVFAANFHHLYPQSHVFGQLDFSRFLEGGAGVVILFILSGFLLSLPFWQALQSDQPRPAIGGFWLKRAVRLVPAYYVALTVLVFHNEIWNDSHGETSIALHYLFAFNYADFSFYDINPPFWALGIFAQFYLLFPLLFLLVGRLPFTAAAVAMLLVGVAAYASHVALVEWSLTLSPWPFATDVLRPGGPVFTHSILAHLPHFIIGMLAGWMLLATGGAQAGAGGSRRIGWLWDLLFWLAMAGALVVLSTELEDTLSAPMGRYALPLVPLLLAAMVFAAVRAPLTGRLLDSAPLRWLGLISYGVYVYHLPVIHMTAKTVARMLPQFGNNLPVLALISLAITVVVATLSWLLLERPAMALVRRWLARRQPAHAGAGVAVVQPITGQENAGAAGNAAVSAGAPVKGWRAR